MPDENKNDMTNNNTGDNGDGGAGTPPSDTSDRNWRQLEEARDRERARADKLMETSVNTIAKGVGVDTSKGVGKLLVKEYRSSLGVEDVPSEEHFQSFLTENGYEVGSTPTSQEQSFEQQQNMGDQMLIGSTPVTPSPIANQIAEAEKQGDWSTAMSLKLANQVVNPS